MELGKPIQKMLVKELQAALKKRNLDTKGLKADLIKRLEEALQNEGGGSEDTEHGKEEKEKTEDNSEDKQDEEIESPKRGTKRKAKSRTPKKTPPKNSKNQEEPKEEEELPQKVEHKETTSKDDKKVSKAPTHEEKKEVPQPVTKENLVSKSNSSTNQTDSSKIEKKESVKVEKKEEAKVDSKPEKKDSKPEKKDSKPEKKETKPEKKDSKPEKKETKPDKKESKPEDNKDSSQTADKQNSNNGARRQRKWGSGHSDSGAERISTDTIKEILVAAPEAAANQKRKREETEIKDEPEKKVEPPKKVEAKPPVKPAPKVAKKEEPEVREVPPSNKPITNVLFITNFVRPLTARQVQELLTQTGKVKDWGMDQIKSRCYVVYETQEEAVATRNALHNLIWPPSNKAKLNVDFSNETDAKKLIAGAAVQEKVKEKAPVQEEKTVTLEDLFIKTIAKPQIYYLPLSDSQVEAKKKVAVEAQSTNSADGAKTTQNMETR